jgi:hypothetical protein
VRLNLILKSRIPPGIKKGCHPIAIDLNLIPYYGEPTKVSQNTKFWAIALSGKSFRSTESRADFKASEFTNDNAASLPI